MSHIDMMVLVLGICLLFILNVRSFSIDKQTTNYNTNYETSEIPKLEKIQDSKFYDGDYKNGYIEVREGAFMFWWLYYADGKETTAYDKPFVIWLQGGPGCGGSGLGNFGEIGPQNIELQNRNHSWVKTRNVLFIDSPVGSGFSYVTNDSLLVKTDQNIANDLVEFMKQFLKIFPKFETVSTHIFSESYGGKIAPIFAYYLHKEIQAGKMTMNLKTVGLGSAYVSPKHYALAEPGYLYNLGFLDKIEYTEWNIKIRKVIEAIDNHEYLEADNLYLRAKQSYMKLNYYNVFQANDVLKSSLKRGEVFMNTQVKEVLHDSLPSNSLPWKFINEKVYNELKGDFLRPSTYYVENLLNETNMNVVIYNGQFDSMTSILGAVEWVHSMRWRGADEFAEAERHNIRGSGNGYYKYHDRLSYWRVFKAGHAVPADNPEAMEHILNQMVDAIDSVDGNLVK